MREQEFLQRVELRLQRALNHDSSGPDVLTTAAAHLCLNGGKRLRPRLVWWFGCAAGASDLAGLTGAAAAAELIHCASLLHDDVVDAGTLRRGRPTVNVIWGNTAAVLSGDLVLTLALAELKRCPGVLTSEAVDLVGRMSHAAIVEVQARGRLELSLEEWRRMAEGKTGELFAWCGRAAAHLAEDAEALERFDRCGRHLGVAFQLADDLLDLTGGADKDQFSDVRGGSPSFPLLWAAEADQALRSRLERAWHGGSPMPEEASELGEAVLRSGALERTQERMEAELEAALEALGPYCQRPGGLEIAGWVQKLGLQRCLGHGR